MDVHSDLKACDLSTLLAEGRRLADGATRAVGQLSLDQVNWKPSEGEWSVCQCFDDLTRELEGAVATASGNHAVTPRHYKLRPTLSRLKHGFESRWSPHFS